MIIKEIKFNSEPYLKMAKEFKLNQKKLKNKKHPLKDIILTYENQLNILKKLDKFEFKNQIFF